MAKKKASKKTATRARVAKPNFEENGAWTATDGNIKGSVQCVGDLAGIGDSAGPFGNWLGHSHNIGLLKSQLPDLPIASLLVPIDLPCDKYGWR